MTSQITFRASAVARSHLARVYNAGLRATRIVAFALRYPRHRPLATQIPRTQQGQVPREKIALGKPNVQTFLRSCQRWLALRLKALRWKKTQAVLEARSAFSPTTRVRDQAVKKNPLLPPVSSQIIPCSRPEQPTEAPAETSFRRRESRHT